MTISRQQIHVFPERVEVYAEPPLHVFVLSHQAPARVITAELGGVLEGDSFDTEIIVEPGARLVLAAQAATKLFAMPGGEARHHRRVHVKDNASLIMMPNVVIPFKDSEYRQTTQCTLGRNSRFVTGEQMMAGRTASGEHMAFRAVHSTLMVAQEGELWPLYREHQCFEPASGRLMRGGYWGRFSAWGSLAAFGWGPLVFAPEVTGDDVVPGPYHAGTPEGMREGPGVYFGASEVAGGCVLRLLADDMALIQDRITAVIQELLLPHSGGEPGR